MKKLSDTLNREVDNCKEMIWAKDKSLEVIVINCLKQKVGSLKDF